MKKIMLFICISVTLSVSIMNVSANEKPINQPLDVKALNDFYGTNYTLDSLKTKILNSIESISLQENMTNNGVCGVVCDINIFTSLYTVRSQSNFYE